MKFRRKLMTPIVLTLGLLGTMLLASPAANAADPTLSATPSTGLRNGQTVVVTGAGFPASTPAFLVQCVNQNQASCNTGNVGMGTTNASGQVSISFKVKTGEIGNGKCLGGSTCLLAIAVGFDPTSPSAAHAAAPITFAAVPVVVATKTKTTAKVLRGKHKVAGKVTTATGTGIAGVRVQLQKRVHGTWKVASRITTVKNGAYASKKVKRGKYRVVTPSQKGYATSRSAVVVVR